jgi:hypothetical protein
MVLPHTEKKKLERIKCIYNDDAGIIDYLADLWDRTTLRDLDTFVRDAQGKPGCLLHACPQDSLVMVILYKSPFAFNDEPNTLMLYAGNDLHELMEYFRNLLEHTSKERSIINGALNDIVHILYAEWIRQADENTQLTFMG